MQKEASLFGSSFDPAPNNLSKKSHKFVKILDSRLSLRLLRYCSVAGMTRQAIIASCFVLLPP